MTSKICTVCNIEKSLNDFRKQRKGKFGKESQCKICRNKYKRELKKKNLEYAERLKIINKKWREKNSEYVKQKYKEWTEKNYEHLLKYYKIRNSKMSPEQRLIQRGRIIAKYWPGSTPIEALEKYAQMMKQQNYSCAICKKPEETFKKSLAVDHNHSTGQVRGALCYRCNRLYVNIHTTETAKKVYDYLLKYDIDEEMHVLEMETRHMFCSCDACNRSKEK